jgi:SAM-dependent methyltransferase
MHERTTSRLRRGFHAAWAWSRLNRICANLIIRKGFGAATTRINGSIAILTQGPEPVDLESKLITVQAEFKQRYSRRGETAKAFQRRVREQWFDTYAPETLPGIDIGCQHDPLNESFRRFDMIFGDGDASLMEGVPDQVFHTVYASHVLEHLVDPKVALRSWYRILRPGGHLIVIVPHRDLYEKRTVLPSQWNGDHKWFWLPDQSEPPHTLSLKQVLEEAGLEDSELVSVRVLDDGYDYSLPADVHAIGEFSIEAIVRRQAHPGSQVRDDADYR